MGDLRWEIFRDERVGIRYRIGKGKGKERARRTQVDNMAQGRRTVGKAASSSRIVERFKFSFGKRRDKDRPSDNQTSRRPDRRGKETQNRNRNRNRKHLPDRIGM